jgi:hypothetical protein
MEIANRELSKAQTGITIADAFTTRHLDLGELIKDTRPVQADSQSMKLATG